MVTVFEFGGPNTYRGAQTKSLIQADQQESGDFLFDVTYGLEMKVGLTYSQACKALGQAILHHQCCEGVASNEGR